MAEKYNDSDQLSLAGDERGPRSMAGSLQGVASPMQAETRVGADPALSQAAAESASLKGS
jgi:hypothetical protein